MQFTMSNDEQGMKAVLTGRFTFQDHAAFRKLVDAIGQNQGGPAKRESGPGAAKGASMTLDLSGVEFIDSAALGMLLLAHDACQTAGMAFIAQSPKGQVRRTLEIAAMGSIFPILH